MECGNRAGREACPCSGFRERYGAHTRALQHGHVPVITLGRADRVSPGTPDEVLGEDKCLALHNARPSTSVPLAVLVTRRGSRTLDHHGAAHNMEGVRPDTSFPSILSVISIKALAAVLAGCDSTIGAFDS